MKEIVIEKGDCEKLKNVKSLLKGFYSLVEDSEIKIKIAL